MSSISFHANCVAIEDYGDSCLVGFADQEFDTQRYLQLQRSRNNTAQDRQLGLDTYYVERDDQLYSCYGGLEHCELHADSICFRFTEAGSKRLQLDGVLRITFAADSKTMTALKTQLSVIFADCGCFDDHT